MKLDGFVILVAAASAILVMVEGGWPTASDRSEFMNSRALPFLLVWTVLAMPLSFALPRLRAGTFGRTWRVPTRAYLLPRWMVRFGLGALIGQSLALLGLALLRDHQLFWLFGSVALVSGAFCAGAWKRIRNHAGTEFTLRWWPPF